MHLRTQIKGGMLMVTIWYKCSLSGQAAHATSPPSQHSVPHFKRLFGTSVQKHTHHTLTDNYVSSHHL